MSSEQEQTAPEQAKKQKGNLFGRLLGFLGVAIVLFLTFGPPVLTVAKLAGVAIGVSYLVLWLPYIVCFSVMLLWAVVFNAAQAAARVAIQELLIAARNSSMQTNALAAKMMAQSALKRGGANTKHH